MTTIARASTGSSTRAARAAAIVTWIYAAGFGGCIVPVSVYLLKHGSLPSFFGLFDMYAGPWWSRFDDGTFAVLLISYLPVTAAAAYAGWQLWRGTRRGAVMSLALLPLERQRRAAGVNLPPDHDQLPACRTA
ncbi:MAG TPA: hypothetical protein VHR39_05105 [Propionibacteriaceae bacterium]|jgi:hypothetical protein|nr:hypothetical protein [Propionibacteriaceae bacterium]